MKDFLILIWLMILVGVAAVCYAIGRPFMWVADYLLDKVDTI